MIKKLRIKFVCVIMVIVMLMLGGVLGLVIHFTGRSMQQQSVTMMRAIADNAFHRGDPGRKPDQVRLPYFVVQSGKQGKVLESSGYFDLSDREYIQNVVDAALNTDRETGELAQYNLRYLKSRVSKNAVIVFSDTTTESATMKNLMCGCGLIFLAAMLVFLGISIRLSGWAVKPVAKAWEQQRQFVADASHELKTPLSVIMANAELLQTAEPEEQKTFSQNILTMTYQMRTLVENMLEMARVDNGTLNMRLEQVDFSQLVCDAVLSFQLLYEEKEMGLDSNIGEHIQLRGSEQHLYQVLDVLLDNALKYSAPKSTVCVELTQSGRCCVLTVRSPGEPIPKEELKNIFKRFYRADKARAMNGSYGLGLSIAEAVVDAHKGKIWAENYEGGNAFSVQLPMNGQTGR